MLRSIPSILTAVSEDLFILECSSASLNQRIYETGMSRDNSSLSKYTRLYPLEFVNSSLRVDQSTAKTSPLQEARLPWRPYAYTAPAGRANREIYLVQCLTQSTGRQPRVQPNSNWVYRVHDRLLGVQPCVSPLQLAKGVFGLSLVFAPEIARHHDGFKPNSTARTQC